MAHLHMCVLLSEALVTSLTQTRQLDDGRRGDNAWPLWGLVMRLAQAVMITSEVKVRG